ncbi:MAG: glycosyltransferase family 9 protein [Planctomycetota bacterium]
MNPILLIKTAALGDVIRTTSILPGLHERYEEASVTWLTAPGAVDLLRTHPLIRRIETVDIHSNPSVESAIERLKSTRWARVLSLDDDPPLARLASAVPSRRLSGVYCRSDGSLAYTPDSAPWNDMGLLSVYGKTVADRMKVANEKSHARILADMLGLRMDEPKLHLPAETVSFAERFAERSGLRERGLVIGLNAGGGGRWAAKRLPVDRSVALLSAIDRALGGKVTFLILGGRDEKERNEEIRAGLAREPACPRAVDGGSENTLLEFGALLKQCDLVVSSDSLALHMCVAVAVRAVGFFAPTSAAEIELYGRGEKIRSTSPDYCSYRREADNSTITTERLLEAVMRQLAECGPAGRARGVAPA